MAEPTSTVDPQQIFISYAPPDRGIAREIGEHLREIGLRVWFDEWEIAFGDSLVEKINAGIQSSNLLLVLLSPEAVESQWVQREWTTALSREMDYRAINVIPAVVRDCEIPRLLADRQYLDLRGDLSAGIERLKQQLGVAVDVDFSKLSPHDFEQLIGDLLVSLGFEVERTPKTLDGGIDLIAVLRSEDPFGVESEEHWVVQTKLYRDKRVGISFIRETFGLMHLNTRFDHALVVTSGQLTSVAHDYLDSVSKDTRTPIRVIEGTELRRLLLQHPSVVRTYFPSEAS